MARPSKYSEERARAICQRIAQGVYPEVAAQAEGIGARTFYQWQADKPQFRRMVARAKAEAEARWAAELDASESTNDRRWLLERTRPERYGVKVEVTAKEQAARALLRLLSERLDRQTFGRVLGALSEDGSEAVDEPADELH